MPKKFEPTAEQKQQVQAMSACGIRQQDIATVMSIKLTTLKKYFAYELTKGVVIANAKVGQTLFQMATSGECVSATIFWAKARMGWTETVKNEHSGTIQHAQVDAPPRTETFEEWSARTQKEIANRATSAGGLGAATGAADSRD